MRARTTLPTTVLDVSLLKLESRRDLYVAEPGRDVRGGLILIVAEETVGIEGEQQLRQLAIVCERGRHQCGEAAVLLRVWIGTGLEQQPHALDTTSGCCGVQGHVRQEVRRDGLDVCTSLQERRNRIRSAKVRREVQRRKAIGRECGCKRRISRLERPDIVSAIDRGRFEDVERRAGLHQLIEDGVLPHVARELEDRQRRCGASSRKLRTKVEHLGDGC